MDISVSPHCSPVAVHLPSLSACHADIAPPFSPLPFCFPSLSSCYPHPCLPFPSPLSQVFELGHHPHRSREAPATSPYET
eukprot:1771239-Amphidinium_carterae.1